MWRTVVLGVVGGLLVAWLALVVALLVARPRGGLLGESLRLLPDLIRLLKRLATDSELPRGVRVRLALLLGYLAMPIDLIPDFIPVLGYADDAIIVVLVLRSVVRRVGLEPLRERWPGSPDGFGALCRLTGLAAR
ncbi:MAG: YkvA family protein [Actinomycetota bacterium]|nr:YkvA family protein [Actinomycetota bacterium]